MDTTKTIAALFDFDGVTIAQENGTQGRVTCQFGGTDADPDLREIFLGPPRSSTRDYGRTQYL